VAHATNTTHYTEPATEPNSTPTAEPLPESPVTEPISTPTPTVGTSNEPESAALPQLAPWTFAQPPARVNGHTPAEVSK
jgi:hypothetical protein